MPAAREITYFEDDAAHAIVDRIFEEERKLTKAKEREGVKNQGGAKRDQHRAETTIRALKEALQFIILERLCKADGQRHPMPDIEEYLTQQVRLRQPAA